MSKRPVVETGPIGPYMRELADGLDALSPADRTDVLAEIRSHIADAAAEAGGDEAKALAGFDSPDLLATRILQERGLVAENRGLQDAPGWMRLTAVAVDAARWLVLLWFLLVVPFGVTMYAGAVVMALAWAYVAAIAAVTVWWWGWKRRRRGYVTAGMDLMGLRRVRVSGVSRLVQATDLGERPRRKAQLIWSICGAMVLLVFVASLGWGLFHTALQNSGLSDQQQTQEVARDVLEVERVVATVYAATLTNQSADDWFASQATGVEAQLVARHAAGGFDDYFVAQVQLPDYRPMPSLSDDPADYTLVALVDVTESSNGMASATYQYRVVRYVTDLQMSSNSGSYSWRWQIEGVTQTDNGDGVWLETPVEEGRQ